MLTKTQCNVIALSRIPGIGSRRLRAIVDNIGGPDGILSVSLAELRKMAGGDSRVDTTPEAVTRSDEFRKELAFIEKEGIKPITYWDDGYPVSLKNIYDPPVIIYTKGALKISDLASVAIVGSRRCSAYGTRMAQRLAYELAVRGVTVVSGMAKGIDTAAHRGALSAGGRTIAVMGSGFGHIYPPGSGKMPDDISADGAVITEYSHDTRPAAGNFPRRNRIISGMSKGVVVVEAARKSGALITADLALDQGREVFAVPGHADSYTSCGVNDLIRNGAKLVTNVDDILEELSPDTVSPERVLSGGSGTMRLSGMQRDVINDLIPGNPVHVDIIKEHITFDDRLLPEVLLTLEMKKIIKQLPGGSYVRCVHRPSARAGANP